MKIEICDSIQLPIRLPARVFSVPKVAFSTRLSTVFTFQIIYVMTLHTKTTVCLSLDAYEAMSRRKPIN